MSKTKAPVTTPSPKKKASTPTPSEDAGKSPSSIFITLALDMSWRLAIVVLVPIIGGFEIDQRLHTTPLLTIVGFVLAMGGVALVLWQMIQIANKIPVAKKEKHS